MIGSRLRLGTSAIIGALCASVLGFAGSGVVNVAAAGVGPQIVVGHKIQSPAGPPTSAQCIAIDGIGCYSPQDIRNQYDYNPAYTRGDIGSGQTIVIFDSFGSPTIRQDLTTFDSSYDISPPPSFQIYEPEGTVTYAYQNASPSAIAHDKNLQTEISWGYETTLDVEWAHAMAPGANIALVATPNAETQGVQGLQNLQNAQRWALDNHIGTIWSNSWASTEQAFHSNAVVERLNQFYATAAAEGVSAFFATGDTGVANTDKQGTLYPYPTVNFPSSSPDVVAVGGTEIPVPQTALTSYNPETVWNDCCGSGGGGYSSIFAEPAFQSAGAIPDSNAMRGLPDVSYNAALISSILIYESFDPTAPPSWVPIGGTSAAAPQWAAIDAIANQADGALGLLTPRLYQIYQDQPAYASAFHDITSGNTSWNGVSGYPASPGWDPASGLGTPDVANLVTALAATSPGTAP
ncbi:MAG: S53 family peptidase [Candidatus Dormiibacterota bacterium]